MRELAMEHVEAGISDTAYLARLAELRARLASFDQAANAGPTFVSARLTPAAYAHGLALALPQVVMASPAVSDSTT